MGYNFKKSTCDVCGISKDARNKLPPMATGINHPTYCITTSFRLGYNGEVWCPECHKEREIKMLFEQIDRANAFKANPACIWKNGLGH